MEALPGAALDELDGSPVLKQRDDVCASELRLIEVVMQDGKLWKQLEVEYAPSSVLDSAPHKIKHLACIPYAVDAEEAGVDTELVAVTQLKELRGCISRGAT